MPIMLLQGMRKRYRVMRKRYRVEAGLFRGIYCFEVGICLAEVASVLEKCVCFSLSRLLTVLDFSDVNLWV